MEHGALEGACFSRRSMGWFETTRMGKAGFAPSTLKGDRRDELVIKAPRPGRRVVVGG
jgi:hypothetical protein